MAKKRIVFVTKGSSRAFFSTTATAPFFISSGSAISLFNSTSNATFFQSGSTNQTTFNTTRLAPIFQSSAISVSMFNTIDTGSVKLLQLRIGELTLNTPLSQVVVPDATGVYDPVTNPGGYNPDGDPPVAGRPERENVYLWTVYRLWTRSGSDTLTPDNQNEEEDDPYEYTLTFPTEEIDGETVTKKGLYEIILIAAPFGTPYDNNNNKGNPKLANYAAEAKDWYETGVGIMVDPDVTNCLNRKRYEFLQGVMCGKCDEDYLELYSIYVGMLASMDAQQWDQAESLYEQLKEKCSTGNLSCNC
jgi:hypothetical protein